VYERRFQPLLPRKAFARRLRRSATAFALLLACALTVGVLGYHFLAHFAWIDALLNASMILSGMGPVTPLSGDGAKLFASAYAIFSGVIFIAGIGVMVAPVAHRFLHHFHLEDEPEGEKPVRRR
jgi:hypothetical protein